MDGNCKVRRAWVNWSELGWAGLWVCGVIPGSWVLIYSEVRCGTVPTPLSCVLVRIVTRIISQSRCMCRASRESPVLIRPPDLSTVFPKSLMVR